MRRHGSVAARVEEGASRDIQTPVATLEVEGDLVRILIFHTSQVLELPKAPLVLYTRVKTPTITLTDGGTTKQILFMKIFRICPFTEAGLTVEQRGLTKNLHPAAQDVTQKLTTLLKSKTRYTELWQL